MTRDPALVGKSKQKVIKKFPLYAHPFGLQQSILAEARTRAMPGEEAPLSPSVWFLSQGM